MAKGQKVDGVGIALGRHSIMNGYFWPVEALSDEGEKEIAREVMSFVDSISRLTAFGAEQAKRLCLEEPELVGYSVIPLQIWREYFPTSVAASKASVKKYRRWVRDRN